MTLEEIKSLTPGSIINISWDETPRDILKDVKEINEKMKAMTGYEITDIFVDNNADEPLIIEK